jgi:hypothetical protein
MTRTLLTLLLAAFTLPAQQPPSKSDLLKLTDELNAAIAAGDWKKAAELSPTLRDAVRDHRNRALAEGGSELLDSVLNWLPADTETIVVAQQPFPFPEKDRTQMPNAMLMAQGFAVGLLERPEMTTSMTGQTVRLAVLAARAFGVDDDSNPDAHREMIPFKACSFVSFAAPPTSVFSRPRDRTEIGHDVWIMKEPRPGQGRGEDTYFAAMPRPDLLLVCNQAEFLREVLTRMASPAKRAALPPDLPEWKLVDRTAPVWGVHHLATPTSDGLPQITGTTAEFGGSAGTVRTRILGSGDLEKAVANLVGAEGVGRRKVNNGTLEITAGPDREEEMTVSLIAIMFLGFVFAI